MAAFVPPAAAQEVPAFVELDFAGDPLAWQGERELATVRFGIERSFLQQNVVEMFRRPLDLQLRLNTQGWIPFEAADLLALASEEGLSLAWNGEVVHAATRERTREGKVWTVLELPVRIDWVEAEAESQSLPPIVLEFEFATEFETDFLGERVPLNQRRAEVSTAEIARELRALPSPREELTFGPCALSASPPSQSVRVGEEFSIVVETIPEEGARVYGGKVLCPEEEGHGSWSVLGELELDRASGVQGRRFDFLAREPGEARIEFEREVFDPRDGSLSTVAAEVLVRVSGSVLPEETAPTIATVDFAEAGQERSWLLVPVVLLGAALLAFYARSMQAQRLRVADWEEQSATPAGPPGIGRHEVGEPLQAWLAEQLSWPPSALVTPRARRRLVEAGVPDVLAKETSQFLAACEAARYGGPAVADVTAQRDHLRRAWETHLRALR